MEEEIAKLKARIEELHGVIDDDHAALTEALEKNEELESKLLEYSREIRQLKDEKEAVAKRAEWESMQAGA